MLENYTYLTSGFTLQEPNVYADSNEQIVKGFSNMLWYVLIVIETLLFSGPGERCAVQKTSLLRLLQIADYKGRLGSETLVN